MTRSTSDSTDRLHQRHTTLWLISVIAAAVVATLVAVSAAGHGAPIVDGAYTGDWCAPAFVGAGPDTLSNLAPPGCALGSEIFWDDWDGTNYGPPDTMGWLLFGVPFAPVPDPEVDIDFFATTADATNVFFTVQLGPFPSTGGPPPHVQIAIDVDGAASGNPFWFDPAGVTLPVGLASLPAGIFPDFLITTDGPASTAQLWEATSAPGAWTPVGVFPLAWSGNIAPGPSIIELAIPWISFAPAPPSSAFALGIPAFMQVMAVHGAPFAGGLANVPMTASEDVFSELGAGFTTSPDICPPSPPSTDCEIYWGPGGGGGTSDAFVSVLYPMADLSVSKSDGVATVIPGTQVSYSITVSHAAGPSAAAGATVTDSFPAALSGCAWTCAGAGGASCTPAGVGNIVDSVTLPTGSSVTYSATCTVAHTAAGNLVNTVTVAAPVGVIDPNPANDTATDTDIILALDYGDAADPSYPTLFASNGARHVINGPFLGASVDSEADGQPTAAADGDDLDGNDDEDGVVFTSAVVAGQISTVTVTATGTGLLDAWIDFNADGDWLDAGEQIFSSAPLVGGANGLAFTPPASAPAGVTVARFRFSQGGGLAPTGLAVDGEVEDEQVSVSRSSDLAMAKSDSRDPAAAGISLRYTLSTTNAGPSDASGVVVSDTLPTATTFLGTIPGSPTCSHSSGTVTCNLGTLSATSSTDVVVTVLVNTGTTGTISNSAGVTANEPDPVSSNDSDSEGTSVTTPLFADAFETGDTSAWANQVPEYTLLGCDLDEPAEQLWASFRLDAGVLRRLRPSTVTLVSGFDDQGSAVFRLELRGWPDDAELRAGLRRDNGVWIESTWQGIDPAAGWMELGWRRSLEGLNDGLLEVRQDGSVVVELTEVDNSHATVRKLAVAVLKGRPAVLDLVHR